MDPRLIVALDTGDRRQALDLAELLLPAVGIFKIGLELFTAHGPEMVRELAAAGAHTFLDLKLHDIPNTVAGAVCSSCALPSVSMLTVHTAGGGPMMSAAVKAARSQRRDDYRSAVPGARRPCLLGVTVLTSLDDDDLEATGITGDVGGQVNRLAHLARESGLDGLVCSPREVSALRQELGPDFVLVTPGIRPQGAATGDQKRTATPAAAIRSGASHLVVGRPITGHTAPLDAARRILDTLP